MIPPLLLVVASWLLRLYCAVARPSSVRCPPRWHLPTGVRQDGSFACAQPLVGGDPDRDGTHGTRDESIEPDGALEGRIYCGDGERPTVTWNGDALVCAPRSPGA